MNKIVSIFTRYLFILIVGLGNLFLFYKLFLPLTFYSSAFLLSLFGEVSHFFGLRLIIFNSVSIEIVNACVAGSAYYLLLILVFSVPALPALKRTVVLLSLFGSLLLFNILRIVGMALIINSTYFDFVHLFFWYVISLVFVVGIWFLAVKVFKIEGIPFYSDYKELLKEFKQSKGKKKKKKSRKKNTKRNR